MKNTALNRVADTIKNVYDPNAVISSNRVIGKNIAQGSTQSEIPVKDIINGIVLTTDGRYVGYVEVIPINFTELSVIQKERIIASYTNLYKNGPHNMFTYILSDISNPSRIVDTVKRYCLNKSNPNVQKSLNDYINLISIMGNNKTVSKRYFIVYEYDAEMTGGRSNDESEIIQAMIETRNHIHKVLRDCGNICVCPDNYSTATAEFIYYYYNRNTSKRESLAERHMRIKTDFADFNARTGLNKEPEFSDIFAPHGMKFISRDCMFMDGIYYGFIGLSGESWPESVYAGSWIDALDFGVDVDIIIPHRSLDKDFALFALNQYNKITRSKANEKKSRNNIEGYQKYATRFQHNALIAQELSRGDKISNDGIFFVIRANSQRELGLKKRSIIRDLKDKHLVTEDAFLKTEDYFKMASPFCFFTPSFNYLKHNTLATDMGSTYCYTAFQMYDPTGYVIGENPLHNSLVSINNFNRDYFANGNTIIIGKTGTGKSYTLMLLAGRMYLSGIRCFFIIPKKGFEYEAACSGKGGTYIRLVPGSSDCVNIMEIRPEGELDLSYVGDDVLVSRSSLLTKKIVNIIMWIQLHLPSSVTTKEYNHMNSTLIKLYKDFGITEDNSSIYADSKTQQLKVMPIIGDMYERFKQIPELDRICDILIPYIEGTCRNMNGQTNVNLDNGYIVFDVDEDDIGEALLPPFLYVAFDYVYSEVKKNNKVKDAIFLDEVWKMMADKNCAKQVQNAVKIVRGYGGATIIATQELNDFMRVNENYGDSVINGSEIRLILGIKEKDLDLVKDTFKLDENDCAEIIKYGKGTALLQTPQIKLKIQMTSSLQEFKQYNTNKNTEADPSIVIDAH